MDSTGPWVRRNVPSVVPVAILGALASLAPRVAGSAVIPGATSPVLCAVILGLAYRNVIGWPDWSLAGIEWVLGAILRSGIALVGFRLTLQAVTTVAMLAVPVVTGCIASAYLTSEMAGRLLGVSPRPGH